jgi:hypothetical protein
MFMCPSNKKETIKEKRKGKKKRKEEGKAFCGILTAVPAVLEIPATRQSASPTTMPFFTTKSIQLSTKQN